MLFLLAKLCMTTWLSGFPFHTEAILPDAPSHIISLIYIDSDKVCYKTSVLVQLNMTIFIPSQQL